MTSQESGESRGESARAWALVVGLAAAVLAWGLLLYAAVGDRGNPPWDFSVVDDLPGSSPYAVHGPKESPTLGPEPVLGGRPAVPQHVGGR